MTEQTSAAPEQWGRAYTAPDISVYYDKARCIHYAACVRGLPQVFNPAQKPWIQADQALAGQVADVVRRCPTGALHYVLRDGTSEQPGATTVEARENGPLFLRGDLTVYAPEGSVPSGTVKDTRLALCRCGASDNKPYCTGAHRQIGFRAAGGQKINTD